MDVYILKTNLTKRDGKSSEIVGVFDSYEAVIKEKDRLINDFEEIIGSGDKVTETNSEDMSVTFVYPKALDGPIYWYSISKKTLNITPETWIVTSDNSKTIGIFSSKEHAFNAVKDYCKKVYDYDVTEESLLSCYVFVHVADKGFDSKNMLHVDTFKIKQLNLNELYTDWVI